MNSLIPVINKLQDVVNSLNSDERKLDLPQIVVVGSQSSGKSSVLENIVGKDFLPRGSGIVTRRPLVLQLNNIPPKGGPGSEGRAYEEWGEFLHKPGEIMYDFQQIKKEIELETERTTGKNKGISNKAITLRVYSPNVLNLTLVDLPGLTRVPVGDQPKDIEKQIRDMVFSYIESPNAIILAVTPANTDAATSDALQIASEVDPNGLRTVGVLTKIDIMDAGTDCMDILMGRVYPLRLGWIGVVNRSQQNIVKGQDIGAAQEAERSFFASHPMYRSLTQRMGTPFLTKNLNKVLMHHIRDTLPDLKMKVNSMLTENQIEMQGYGESYGDGEMGQGAMLLQVITRFSQDYRDIIDGQSTQTSNGDDMFGGARVNYIFNDIFKKHLDHIDPVAGLSPETIRLAIRNATGTRASIFIPEQAFEILVKKQIQRMRDPSLQCINLVYDELQRIVSQVENVELERYGVLRERLIEVVNDLLRQCKEPTMKMVTDLINIELSYINTNHPEFIGGGGALGKFFDRMSNTRDTEEFRRGEKSSRKERKEVEGEGPSLVLKTGTKGTGAKKEREERKSNSDDEERERRPKNNRSRDREEHAPDGGPHQSNFFSTFFGAQQGGGDSKSSSDRSEGRRERRNGRDESSSSRSRGGDRERDRERSTRKTSSRRSEQKSNSDSRLARAPSNMIRSSAMSDKDQFEAELIRDLMASYFDIARGNIMDVVPKAIMYFLVNESKKKVQNALVQNLYREDLFSDLLEESPDIAERRKACQQQIATLRKAQAILNEVRDFSSSGGRGGGSSSSAFRY